MGSLYNILYTLFFMFCVSIVAGKIGYGTFSEALAYKLPFIFVRRDYFNEEPFLRNMLEVLHVSLHFRPEKII